MYYMATTPPMLHMGVTLFDTCPVWELFHGDFSLLTDGATKQLLLVYQVEQIGFCVPIE